jgi:peroxiredoxin
MKIVRLLLIGLSFFVLTGMGSNAPGGEKKPYSPTEIEKLDRAKAPDFTLQDLNGKNVPFNSFQGKVVVLNFWATWCPACVTELPSLSRLQSEWKSRGLEVVAVSNDASAEAVREYTAKKGFTFSILHDASRAVTKQYKIFALPTTFLIDKHGTVVEKFFGEYDWTSPEMKKKIEKLF